MNLFSWFLCLVTVRRRTAAAVVWVSLVGVALLTVSVAPARAAADRPNIVVILADDMGYGDVQALNPESQIPTPHLNQLAAAGMTFTDAHSPSAVCTPTRYGLVTGRYCWRTRLKRGVLNGYGEPLIQDTRLTIAEFLRQQGYRTGIVGKWHLGLGFAKSADGEFDFSQPVSDGPHTHGFDHSFVIPASLDFPPYIYIRNGELTEFPSARQPSSRFPKFWRAGERSPDFVFADCLDRLSQEAGTFIKQAADQPKPFFLYFPLTAPHKPVLPHARFQDRTELGPYADFIVQVDDTVGRVLAALDEAQVAEDTVVIYTSDNGSFMFRRDDSDAEDHVDDETIQAYRSDRHTANGPLRGTKADVWEAGHRVPFFVRWPGVAEAGSKSSATICHTDIFASCAEIVGAAVPESAAPDSYSFVPQLRQAADAAARPPVINHSGSGMFAIRDGDWKLVLGNGSGGREAPKGEPFKQPYQLFHLGDDLAEQHNVIQQNSEKAAELEAAFHKIHDRDQD